MTDPQRGVHSNSIQSPLTFSQKHLNTTKMASYRTAAITIQTWFRRNRIQHPIPLPMKKPLYKKMAIRNICYNGNDCWTARLELDDYIKVLKSLCIDNKIHKFINFNCITKWSQMRQLLNDNFTSDELQAIGYESQDNLGYLEYLKEIDEYPINKLGHFEYLENLRN